MQSSGRPPGQENIPSSAFRLANVSAASPTSQSVSRQTRTVAVFPNELISCPGTPRLYLISITALSAPFSITMCQSVTSCLSYSERAPLQRRSGIRCFVITHKCHQQPSMSVAVLCSKCLTYVNAVCSQVPLSKRGKENGR